MNKESQNHPFIVFAVCFLWLFSLIAIGWSLLLFVSVSDLLLMTGLDLVNAFVLLSGLVMLPTNVHMLYSIANGIKINYNAKVLCCPLWLSIFWIIVINGIGAALCIHKIHSCPANTNKAIRHSMEQYRNIPEYKSFIDNLQWNLKCCGSDSYKDWFNIDWYDKIQNYEWDPNPVKRETHFDNVPLSCCKSGSCVSNYLSELGTRSINTNGCNSMTRRIILLSMHAHLYMFVTVIILEVLVLRFIMKNEPEEQENKSCNIRHIMNAKGNFNPSNCSYQVNLEGCEDDASRDY